MPTPQSPLEPIHGLTRISTTKTNTNITIWSVSELKILLNRKEVR